MGLASFIETEGKKLKPSKLSIEDIALQYGRPVHVQSMNDAPKVAVDIGPAEREALVTAGPDIPPKPREYPTGSQIMMQKKMAMEEQLRNGPSKKLTPEEVYALYMQGKL